MRHDARMRARRLLSRFVATGELWGNDARELEGCLCELEEYKDVLVEEFCGMLAQYTPRGGEHLLSEREILPRAQAVLAMLNGSREQVR